MSVIRFSVKRKQAADAPPSDVRLHDGQHLAGGLVDLHEHGVVDLAQTQQLQDLADLGANTHDTTNTDDKGNLGLRLHVEVARATRLATQADQRALLRAVLLHILLGALERLHTVRAGVLAQGGEARFTGSLQLLELLALAENGLGHSSAETNKRIGFGVAGLG